MQILPDYKKKSAKIKISKAAYTHPENLPLIQITIDELDKRGFKTIQIVFEDDMDNNVRNELK
jgi:hypothetical protein